MLHVQATVCIGTSTSLGDSTTPNDERRQQFFQLRLNFGGERVHELVDKANDVHNVARITVLMQQRRECLWQEGHNVGPETLDHAVQVGDESGAEKFVTRQPLRHTDRDSKHVIKEPPCRHDPQCSFNTAARPHVLRQRAMACQKDCRIA